MTPRRRRDTSMEADRWQRLKEIFAEASKLKPGLRPAYLDEACADDPALRREAESLLACDARGGDPLTRAVAGAVDATAAASRGPELSDHQLLGKYRVLERIGKGGMGEVYRAEDTTLERQVALKVLPAEVASSDERLARFEREAKSLAALEHPNIVAIHSIETGVAEEDPAGRHTVHFLTMQLVEGRRLDDLIPEGGMPIERIVAVGIELTDALDAAHQRGIVHRDLKPSNVMMTETGHVMVLDFGLAKLRPGGEPEAAAEPGAAPLTREDRILGTPPYTSPEQVEGKELDARSDLFSLGVMLYEMATGARPFRGSSSSAVIASILRDVPPAAETLRPSLPSSLARLIGRCLEKDPEHRFQSAAEVRGELEQLKRELESRPEGWPETPRLLWLRHRRRAAQAAGLVSLLVVGTLVGSYLYRTRPYRAESGGFADQPIQSLAVLPFDNLMNDPEQDYFVDGMTDALINDMARIGSLRVISRTSIMQFKSTDLTLPEIARELGVDAVVEGSVFRAGDQIRVTANLIEAATDRHLWTETYEREVRDVLRLQSELARSIAGRVRAQLTTPEQERLAQTRSVDPEAHDAYLKGRFHGYKESVPGFTRALDYFRRAIEIDPDFAPAHSGLADAISFLAIFGARPPETMEQAKEQAGRALELDPNLAEAHISLGIVNEAGDWDWLGAEEHFLRAIELSPNSASAYYHYSMLLRQLRRYDEAIENAVRAVDLDPLSLNLRTQYGAVFYHTKEYAKAAELLEGVLELDPDFIQAQWNLFLVYAATGAYTEAMHLEERMLHDGGVLPTEADRQAVRRAYADSGWSGFLEAVLEKLRQRYPRPFTRATFLALLGRREETLTWLERAEEEREPALGWINSDPVFDPLRSDPRFQRLLRKINLPASTPAPDSQRPQAAQTSRVISLAVGAAGSGGFSPSPAR